jgi:hypothetical protein
MDWACRTYGEQERVLVGISEGRRSLGKRRHSWEDYIQIDLEEVEWHGLDCSGS